MALINHSHKFVFVHIPKAAGTSITKVLSELTSYRDIEVGGTHFGELIQSAYARRFGIHKHSPAARLRKVVGADRWNDYFTFTFVRNPYDRVISVYKFLRRWEGCPSDVRKKMRNFPSVNEYVMSGMWEETSGPDEIFRPQAYWVTDPEDRSRVIVDRVYKVENIDQGINDIFLRVLEGHESHGRAAQVPCLNASKGRDSELVLSSDSIAKINRVYARDFNLFGYELVKP